ncbi:MAG: hypothetical protein PHW10_04555 [Candidatus Peribacteraceae bacterium]|nr:hypothetical protein [Candidatus Peribacteraceae bacterium]
MIPQLFRVLPYVSAAGIAAYFVIPWLRRWLTITSCLFFLLLAIIHLTHPQSVAFTKLLLFNMLAVIPVTFLRVFGPLPVLALSGKPTRIQSRLPTGTPRPSSMLRGLIQESGTDMPRGAAMGFTALIATAILMFFVLGAVTVGWGSTVVSLAFLLPVLKPSQAETTDAFDAMMTIPLFFLSCFLALGGLWLNDTFFHASVAAQSKNFLFIWPDYPDADKMFFAVCSFAIMFQLTSLWKTLRR